MRHINHHAQTVHFTHDFFAKISEMFGAVVVFGSADPGRDTAVGQAHIPRSEAVELAQNSKIGVDHVTALDADEGGDLPFPLRACNIV